MKILPIWVVFTIVCLKYAACLIAGNFKATIFSIDNYPKMPRKFANWKFVINRKSRHEKVVSGYFDMLKTVVEPTLQFETLVWSNGHFVKMALDHLLHKVSLCEKRIKARYFDEAFTVTNMTWEYEGSSCALKPGLSILSPDFDLNKMVHEYKKDAIYNRYLIKSVLLDAQQNKILALDLIIDITKR